MNMIEKIRNEIEKKKDWFGFIVYQPLFVCTIAIYGHVRNGHRMFMTTYRKLRT